MTHHIKPELLERAQPRWSDFLARYDPSGQLSSKQAATIRQLYQALRQCGYNPTIKTGGPRL